MNDILQTRMRESTERYDRDIPGLPDWEKRTEARLSLRYARMVQRLRTPARLLDSKEVLDLGCGSGGFAHTALANSFGTRPNAACF